MHSAILRLDLVWGLLGFNCNTAPFLVQIRSIGTGFCKACTDLIGFVVPGVLCKQSPSFPAMYSILHYPFDYSVANTSTCTQGDGMGD